jgi:hypothetical protein
VPRLLALPFARDVELAELGLEVRAFLEESLGGEVSNRGGDVRREDETTPRRTT